MKATRRKQRLRRLFGGSADLEAAGADLSRPIPSDELQSRQEIARVYRVLDRLPERQRRVLILFELEGMSTPDIAALIGARVGTVRVWLYRARAAFLEHHEAIAAGDRKWEDRNEGPSAARSRTLVRIATGQTAGSAEDVIGASFRQSGRRPNRPTPPPGAGHGAPWRRRRAPSAGASGRWRSRASS